MTGKLSRLLAGALSACVALGASAAGDGAERTVRIKEARAALKSGPLAKIGPTLAGLHAEFSAATAAGSAAAERAFTTNNRLVRTDRGHVAIDAIAARDTAALERELARLGATHTAAYGRWVSARLPIGALDELAGSATLARAMPALAQTNAGTITSEGDQVLKSDIARGTFGVDGSGVRVGALSDSFDCVQGPFVRGAPFSRAGKDFAADDLSPKKATLILDDQRGCPGGSDEGRAMMQLIHDVAPGASLAFHTAVNGQADFALGIVELAAAGANVIVDDVIYFAEPMFQDGVIAQAADFVFQQGVPYFSSVGNRARLSYSDAFRPIEVEDATWHDFDAGVDVDITQDFVVGAGGLVLLSFQWDEPWFSVSGAPGSASDVDVVVLDAAGDPLPACDAVGNPPPGVAVCQGENVDPDNVGGDAVDNPFIVNVGPTVNLQLAFLLADGPAPGFVKYVIFTLQGASQVGSHDTQSPSGYGHNHAAGAEAVGASFWGFTTAFGDPFFGGVCDPACLNSFSSAGGTPIFFDVQGRRLAQPEIRVKPGVTGPDGGNTTFFFADSALDADIYPNFFGTSASAPHVAGVAALMIEAAGGPRSIAPQEIYDILRSTAHDMRRRQISVAQGITIEVPDAEGFDNDTGFGLVDAEAAVNAVLNR